MPRRPLERRGRPRAQGQPRRRAGAAADARSPATSSKAVKRDVRRDDDRDPIADVMISGTARAATLKDEALQLAVTTA